MSNLCFQVLLQWELRPPGEGSLFLHLILNIWVPLKGEFSREKSSGEIVVSPQTFRSYLVKKWGDPSSHLPDVIKKAISESFNKDQDFSAVSLLKKEVDRTGLSFANPTGRFCGEINLRQDDQVLQTLMDMRIDSPDR